MQSTLKRMLDDLARPRVLVNGQHAAPPGWWYLTLNAVNAPILLPAPSSPGLQGCEFFFSRRQAKGLEGCLLHLGYFATEAEAQKWRAVLSRVYPRAIASRVALTESEMARAAAAGASPISADPARAEQPTSPAPRPELTDTQVLSLLEDYCAIHANPRPSSASGPATAAAGAAQKASKRKSVSLEDTLNELRNTALDVDVEPDPLSSTGVRHLRIEVAKSRKPESKRAKGARGSRS